MECNLLLDIGCFTYSLVMTLKMAQSKVPEFSHQYHGDLNTIVFVNVYQAGYWKVSSAASPETGPAR